MSVAILRGLAAGCQSLRCGVLGIRAVSLATSYLPQSTRYGLTTSLNTRRPQNSLVAGFHHQHRHEMQRRLYQALHLAWQAITLGYYRIPASWRCRGIGCGCQKNHPEYLPQATHLPTRVIDVGEPDGSRLSLYISNGAVTKYVALSHCWGQVTHLMTTPQSLEAHINGIEWTSLSQTFRDAVITTRKLGIRYLWIDSLCILQGDVQDWELESGRMADIYAGAHVVLAATYAPDGSIGLFARKSQEHWPPIFIGYNKNNSKYEIYSRSNRHTAM
jgi:hypothetical protein